MLKFVNSMFYRIFLCFCSTIPLISIIVSVVLIFVLLLFNQQIMLIYGLVFLVPIIIISLFLLSYLKHVSSINNIITSIQFINVGAKQLTKIYYLVFTCTYLYIIIYWSNDWVVLLLLLILYILTFVLLFCKDVKLTYIISELFASSFLFAFLKNILPAYPTGAGDGIAHIEWIKYIIDSGTTDGLVSSYTNHLATHIYGAIGYLVSNIGYEHVYVILGIASLIISGLFVYFISYKLTKNHVFGMFTIAIYYVMPVYLRLFKDITPKVFLVVYFSVILFFFFSKSNINPKCTITCVSLCTLSMCFSHHAQLIPYVLFILFISISLYLFVPKILSKHNLLVLTSMISTILGYSSIVAISRFIYYFETYILSSSGSQTLPTVGLVASGASSLQLSSSLIMYILPSVFVVLLSILGSVFLSKSKGVPLLFLITMTPLSLIFVDGLAEAGGFSSISIFLRLQAVLLPIMCIFLSIGIFCLWDVVNNIKFTRNNIASIIVLIFFILFMASSSICYNSKDNTIFLGTNVYESPNFNSMEMSAMNLINAYTYSEKIIYTDAYSQKYFGVSHKNSQSISLYPYSPSSYVVFRPAEYDQGSLLIASKTISNQYIENGALVKNTLVGTLVNCEIISNNKIYDNKLVLLILTV